MGRIFESWDLFRLSGQMLSDFDRLLMVASRARFDGRSLILEEPVELPRDRTLIVHIEAEVLSRPDTAFLRPVLVPTDPAAARLLIHDAEAGMENF